MSTMKNLVHTFTLALATLAAPFAAEAAGHIYSIEPWDPIGEKVTAATGANLQPGQKAWFTVRLFAPTQGGNRFRLHYLGTGSEILDRWITRRPWIGVYVSGEMREAYLEDVKDRNESLTDFVFSYTVKAGDFALPIRLADQSGKMLPHANDDYYESYYLNFRNETMPVWDVDDSTETAPKTVPAEFCFGTPGYSPREGGAESSKADYYLEQCQFNVETVGFDKKSEASYWRTVHEGTTQVAVLPSLAVSSMPTNDVDTVLYVWSTDEAAVKIPDGDDVTLEEVEPGVMRNVRKIRIIAGKQDYEFDIFGVSETGGAANDGTAKLVLSGFPHYNFRYEGMGTPSRITDYREVTVKCSEALPPYVAVKVNGDTDYTTAPNLGKDYNVRVATVQVQLSKAYDKDVDVNIVPSLPASADAAWTNYVGLSLYEKGAAFDQFTNLTFTAAEMKAGTLSKSVQVYAFGSDELTAGPDPNHAVRFAAQVTGKNGADAFYSNNEKNTYASLYLNQVYPVVSEPANGAVIKDVPGASTYSLTVKATDTYRNIVDTNGYKIVFKYQGVEQDIECPTSFSANGRWHLNANGEILENGGVVPVKFDAGDGQPHDAELWLVGPDGKTKSTYVGGPVSPANVKISVTVDPAATITPVVTTKTVAEGETVEVKFKLGPEGNRAKQTMYAFLIPDDSCTNMVSGADTGVVIDGSGSGGAEIMISQVDSGDEAVYVTLLDGLQTKAKGGTSYRFKVALCTTPDYDETKLVQGYELSSLTLKAWNVEPKLTEINTGKLTWPNAAEEQVYPLTISKGIAHTFEFTGVDEPGDLDREAIYSKWTIDEYDLTGQPLGTSVVTNFCGSLESNKLTYSFLSAGYAKISIRVWDKDMKSSDTSATYKFRVNVSGSPAVTLTETDSHFSELASSGQLTFRLSASVPDDLIVRAVVTPYEDSDDPGRLILDPTKRCNDDPEKGLVTTNEYWLYFRAGSPTAMEQNLTFSDLDGTFGSTRKGFRIALSIDTNAMAQAGLKVTNQFGIPYNEYFNCQEGRIFIDNDAPEVVAPPSNEPVKDDDKGYQVQIGANEAYAINFSVANDAPADVEHGFKVRFICNGGGGTLDGKEYTSEVLITNLENHVFIPSFNSQGKGKTITLHIEDKDTKAGTQPFERTWYYDVQASKTLRLLPHGPLGGFSTSAESQRYAGHTGCGHVWTGLSNPTMKKFNLSYNCGTVPAVDIFAFGYKTNAVDNGELNGARDVAIDPNGDATAAAGDGPFYTYEEAEGKDSFFYRWLQVSQSAEGNGDQGGGAASVSVSMIAPERPTAGVANGSALLSAAAAEDGSYPETVYEAVFAKEWLPSDNAGDINQDGIPDVYMVQYKFGVIGDGGTVVGDDMEKTAIRDNNDDADFLPAAIDQQDAAWPDAKAAKPFTAKLEIRGFGDSLNNGPALLDVGGIEPDPEFNELELFAAVSLGYADAAAVKAAKWAWSPERPTDPTKLDTDNDGLPDGYEYWFWYRANVGYLDKDGGYHRLTGRRYNPLRPDTGDVIGWQEIAEAFDPRNDIPNNGVSADEMNVRDTDNDGLTDLEEFALNTNPVDWDTDGDGLPDGFEVMHGLNPCKDKTDGQNADGAANPDGDYMAAAAVKLTVIESYDDENKCPTYYATTRALTADDVEVGEPTACWRVKIGGSYYVIPDEAGDDPTKFFVVPPESPEEPPEEGGEEIVANGAGAGLVIGGGGADKPSAEDWYLAADLSESDVFSAKPLTEEDPALLVRGSGACLLRGERLDEAPVYLGGDVPGGYVVRTLKVKLPATGSAEDFTNRGFTAWRYGSKGLTTGDGKFCQFALGQSAEIPEGTAIFGEVMTDQDVLLLHHNVYQWRGLYLNEADAKKFGTLTVRRDMGTGFNPTTGWFRDKSSGCVNGRWSGRSTAEFEPMQDCSGIRDMAGFGTAAYPGVAVDTLPYATGDEFLLMNFRYNAGHIGKDAMAPKASETMQAVWTRETTVPVNGEGTFGADTDADGVPDGWELYVATGPSKDESSLGGAATYSPLKGSDTDTILETDWVTKQGWASDFTLVSKFAGTDTMIAYADVPSVADEKNLYNKRWLNKFWPLDPWSFDTDCDGIPDHQEGESATGDGDGGVNAWIYNGTEIAVHSGIYGSPTDDGSKCIAGGGMNPNSWDTDLDGLPDLWEGQDGMEVQDLTHHGWYVSVTTGSGTNAVSSGSFQGGMDPTVKDSYTRLDEGVDRDYDHDGLQNWQEYMTGVIRAFRYDDALSPWTVPQWSEATGSDEMFLEALKTGKRLDPLTEGGSNPHLVFGKFDYLAAYGSQCRRPSDYACGYWYFFPDGPNHILRQGLVTPGDGCPYAAEVKAAGQSSKVVQTYGPAMYFTCSPTCADSDADGMDDYYELFHGMDPLYGGDKGRDLIALRWANGYPLNNVSAKNNLWTYTLKARGTSADAKLYDFAVYPWMAGDPAADPDGDDIRNVDEAIQANAQANETWLHTDPTPLWMTDSSDPNSLVSRYYGGIATSADPDLKDQYALAVPATAGEVELPFVMPLAGHRWGVCNDWRVPQVEKRYGYSFAFEENDGYDTDHDGLSDAREAHALATTASDPQDSDDPMRRQAMYFPGAKSALQARSDAVLGLDGKSELFFLEFTVECWVKPEDVSRAQTIIERVIRHPNSNPGDWNLYRRNFQLGIDENGHFFAAYDSNGTGTDRVTATAATLVPENTWAHLAATYDGHALVLYVNGNPAYTQPDNTHPATSAETIVSKTAETELGKIATESAIVMGASIAPTAPFFSLVAGKSTWANYDRFYKGYLDEVRVWDGARDGVSIADDYKARKRYTKEDLLANREAVFAAWSAGVRRNLTDDIVNTAETGTLPPELVYHYTFDGLFGAVEESLVAQEPNGFSAPISAHGKAYAARPANWVSPGWRDLSVHSLAYHNYAYVPWIPNLVAHLPPFDGTTLDSVYWSEDYAGAESADSLGLKKFGFPRTSEPEVNFTPVQQDLVGFDPDSTRLAVIGWADKAFAFAKRARVLYATDLLPLGDAFVKFSTDFWDTTDDSDQGGSTITETSGQDNDFDNLPDWWEKLVAGGDLATYSWKTEMTRDGVTRTAGEWFVLDTARGAHDTKTGGVLADPDYAAKSSVKGDGVPDWWKSLYGIDDAAADSDFDGLLNGVEYRVYLEKLLREDSELSPVKNVTDGHVLDYYRKTVKWDYTNNCPAAAEAGPSLMGMMKPGVTKTGSLYPYAGFVLTDHDFIDDTWEDLFGADYISRKAYDASRDKDLDGWSNWSEFLAGTAPDGSAKLSLVRSDGAEDHALEHFPIPTLRATVSLDGDAKFDQDIVVKAWHGASAVGEPDASWKVAGSGQDSAWFDRFLGLAPNRLVKFNIGPGDIGENHVMLEFYDPNYWIETIKYEEGKIKEITITEHTVDNAEWGVFFFGDDPASPVKGSDTGSIGRNGFGIGCVNYRNGDIEVDFANPILRETDATYTQKSGEDEVVIYHYDFTRAFWRVRWMSRLTEIGNTKTFSLSRAETGHLRQGVNTFVAYIPDENGNYVPGAPLGVARNVDVGWDKVTDLSIALTANAGDWRFSVAGEGVKPVRIERTAVNGVATPARAIWASKADLSLRNWFTEADYVRSALGEYDLDWRWLAADAANAGIADDDISTADYRLIVDGTVVTNFSRAFAVKRQAATAVEPSGNSYMVRTARPTFRWAGVSGMTAFELQVATDEKFENVVWTSGTRTLPVLENGLRVFKSDCYVGEELEDGKVYFWRVAEMNAKWPTADAWSVPAQFRTEVDSSGNTTGYGQLKADVRYYGVSGADMDKVVVGVYATADFTGLPVARKRLSTTLGDKVSALAYSAPLGKDWMDTTANVTLDGIAPGRYYVMAFIDENGNGQRDVWESWGYVNSIGKKTGSIFTPVEVEVAAGKLAAAPALLCIDDTDVNDDHVPDCLQDGEDWENPDYGRPEVSKNVDTDADGLSDYDEEYFYGTDLDKPDTDGDGMPDGWEAWAGTEPTYADADNAAEGDVMAYLEISLKRITLEDGTELLLSEGESLGTSKEASKYNGKLWNCYVYRPASVVDGVEIPAVYGLGQPYTPALGQVIKGQAVDVKVALVHNQVYQYRRGYDMRTANPVAFAAGTAVDTKPFTAYDKYAVWAYLRAIGYTAETAETSANWNAFTLKAGKADANDDLVDDGWQLYVMFSLGETFGKLGKEATVSVFTADKTLAGKTMTAGGEGLFWTQEYDYGRYPTDPWQASTQKDTYTIDGVTYVISDKDAYAYHLKHFKGEEGDKYADYDNDGLANYDEYVIQKDNNRTLDADKMFSYFGSVTIPTLAGQCVPDYFLKSTKRNAAASALAGKTVYDYLGFDTTSHDFIEQWFKDSADGKALGLDRTVFEAYKDYDSNGWDNYSEARAKLSGRSDNTIYAVASNTVIVTFDRNTPELTMFNATNKAEIAMKEYRSTGGYSTTVGEGDAAVTENHPAGDWYKEGTSGGFKSDGSGQIWDKVRYTLMTEEPLYKYDGHPTPAVELTLTFDRGAIAVNGSNTAVTVAAYSTADTPDATWTVALTDDDLAKGNVSTVLKVADTGCLRQGKTKFVAFAGVEYVPGEAFGTAADVDVGWDKVVDLKIDLTASSPILPRFKPSALAAAASNATDAAGLVLVGTNEVPIIVDEENRTQLRVVRCQINGEPCFKRIVLNKTIDADQAVTEADVIGSGRYDLDWLYLERDAAELGIALDEIKSVQYVVYSGAPGCDAYGLPQSSLEDSNAIGAIVKTFNRVYAKPVAVSPSATAVSLVTETRPTFEFKAAEGYTAFAFQLVNAAGEVVFASTNRLATKNAAGNYTYRPPVFFGWDAAESVHNLLPNGDYGWRVALFNDRYRAVDANAWSDSAAFKVELAKGKVHDTGKGILEVAVRYYGDAPVDADHPIVVQAFKTADFTGAPEGQAIVTAIEKLSAYDDTNTVNAVICGLPTGDYYVRAFVDTTNDCVKSSWESWGYQNKVATGARDIYTPVATTVGSDVTSKALVFVEDMDGNGGGIPDWMESWPDPLGADADHDGLSDADEAIYFCDPLVWDTDGDGMPDGFEAWASPWLDPVTADGDLAGEGDVMAYQEIKMKLVTLVDGTEFLLKEGQKLPQRGDDASVYTYYPTYMYGDIRGVILSDKTGVAGTVESVEEVPVALIHDQVLRYADGKIQGETAFRDNFRTVATVEGLVVTDGYTKAFTALDKYLYIRYWANLYQLFDDTLDPEELEDTINRERRWGEVTVKPGLWDTDGDGIADGWELFVGTNPTDAGDRDSDYDGDGATLIEEYNRGVRPLDPNHAFTVADGLSDGDAVKFHLVTREDQLADEDFDGLSNWAEYLATKAGYGTFDVEDAYSATGDVLDYFVKIADGDFAGWYVGEALIADTAEETGWHMIADHDFVEDWWEDEHGANRYSYDSFLDEDQDGWDNWSTARSSMSEDVIMEDKITKRKHTFIDLNAATYEAIINNPETYEIIEDTVQITAREDGDIATGKLVVNVKTVEKVPRAYPTPKVDLTLTFPRNFIAGGVSNDVIASVCAYTTRKDVPDATWSVKLSNLEIENGIIRTQLRKADTGAGKLRQGLNTFVVTAEGGKYTGVARDVDVGWDLVTDVAIDLTTDSAAFPIFSVGGSNATDRVRVVRAAINGQEFRRTVWKSAKDVTGGTFTEIDLVNTKIGEFDFDWNTLLIDAAYCGIGPEEISTASYEILSGTNVVGVYEKTFPVTRTRPILVRPATNDLSKVLAARPTFVWKGGEGVTAFVLQVSDDETFASDKTLVATNFLPATYADGRTYSPAWYVGEELENDKTYFWRVAELNAKWQTPEDGWSKTATFTTAIDTTNANTGYGRVAADVRYYGPADATLGDVVVAAYKTADFTGKPVARKRLEGSDSVSTLAKKADPTTFLDVTANVTLDGIAPGRYYVMAFIDSNTNGVRDVYESWGYVCKVGTKAADTWSPVALEVVSTKVEIPAGVLIIEDTDVNRDMIPDAIEDMSDWTPEPEGPEPDFPEEGIDEDPEDGIPDDWEDVFGVDDPDAALPNQWMAYAETNVTFVKIGLTKESAAWYAVMDPTDGSRQTDGTVADGTDASVFTSLVTVWEMGEKTGVGTNVTFAADSGATVWESEVGKASLIHAQVYAAFGYETGCAAAEGAPHTKAMTARDKYLVCRYLENIGIADVSETNLILMAHAASVKDRRAVWLTWTLDPTKFSTDGDDVSDGWELYTMFGTTGIDALTAGKGLTAFDDARISAWKQADGRVSAPAWDGMTDAEGNSIALTLDQEFDDGYLPTDPWSVDTDRDGVIDYYAYQYLLKGDDAGEDADGDGLPNYAEYLVGEVFRYAKLDPKNPKTDGFCVDYFRKMGDLYLGEIFTDHDQVDDQWEAEYATVANRYVYDPNRDDDKDGWSNYEEYCAGTSPCGSALELGVDGKTKSEFPVPIIDVKVVCNGKSQNLGAMVFQAWNEKFDSEMLAVPDATWKVANGSDTEETGAYSDYEKYLGVKPSGLRSYVLQGGQVAETSVKISFLDTGYSTCSVDGNKRVVDVVAGEAQNAKWYPQVYDRSGKLVLVGNVLNAGETEVGTIDYRTGRMTIDFSKLNGLICGSVGGTSTNEVAEVEEGETIADNGPVHTQRYDLINLKEAHVLIAWQAMNVGLSAGGQYYLTDAERGVGRGYVRSGKTTFVCFNDRDGSGTYTPGEPYGVVRGVDVGWQGAKFTVELSETIGMNDRVVLWGSDGAAADDRDATIEGDLKALMGDKTLESLEMIARANGATNVAQIAEYVATLQARLAERVVQQPASESAGKIRVRVVRYGIDDRFMYMTGVSQTGRNQYDQLVVFDKEFDRNGRSYVSEADFIGEGKFDIDWGTLSGTSYLAGAVVNGAGEPLGTGTTGPLGSGCSVTNMTYLIVLGDGAKDFLGSDDTNTTVRVAGTITRRFDRVCATPKCEGVIGGGDLTPAGVVYTAHPTFVWSMPGESAWTKRFGSSYTAFQLRIRAADGTLVYVSDVTRAPGQDAEGRFVWTAPISVGGQTPQGKVFANNATYTWDVAMFNAKFMPGSSAKWAQSGTFSTSVNVQQPMNDAGFSSVGVTVKYTGPEKTLYDRDAKAWLSDDLAKTNGKVRVQAFTTADFSGTPACETVVADHAALFDTANVFTNAVLKGLADGTYYIRAYIDSNGNFAKDDFESWGAAKEPVTVGPDVVRLPAVSLYIEDADTNGNWYPDAWEYQYLNRGKLTWEQIAGQKAAAPREDGKIVLAKAVYDQMVNGLAGISTGLSGAKITMFQDAKYAELLLDPDGDWDPIETTFDAIRKAVEKKIVDKTLKITAITLDTDNSAVVLAMDAEVDYANLVSGNLATRLYDLDAMNVPVDCTVTVKVYKKATLAQEGWDLVDTVTKTFGQGETSVTIPVKDDGDAIDPASGFYKVEVVQ